MSQWSFVIAAYSVTLVGTAIVSVASYRAMRRAEAKANELGGRE